MSVIFISEPVSPVGHTSWIAETMSFRTLSANAWMAGCLRSTAALQVKH